MRFSRILALTGLFAALSPLSLSAQATSSARCADGTKAESRYTACWFHGGVVVASTPAPKPRAETPARSAKLRESPPPSAAHKAHVAAPSHKAASKTARAPKPPKGATALCKDGSYTDNKKPKKGCKKHEGVARVLRGSGRRDLNPRPPEPHSGALPGCATSRLAPPPVGRAADSPT